MSETQQVTQLLRSWREGNSAALERLMPLVHTELHDLASALMRGERRDHTLGTTGLIHEAFLKLVDADVDWNDRVHFYAVSAKIMRRILVDHARARRAEKRGGDQIHLEIREDDAVSETDPDILALDQALTALAKIDERKARIVELTYFAGMKYREVGEVENISDATVERELRFAKAWLHARMSA